MKPGRLYESSEIPLVATTKIVVFWNVLPCNLHLQGRRLLALPYPEDGGSKFLWNICIYLPNYMVLHPWRL